MKRSDRLEGPNSYVAEILTDGSSGRRTYRLDGQSTNRFRTPDNQKGKYKLYVFSRDQEILYVGITKMGLSARIGLGLRGSGNYHGYKLNDGRYQLHVWTASGIGGTDLEAIEAEVAFEWRTCHGNWPASQNEIHFHQTDEQHRSIARQVVDSVCPAVGRERA